MMANNVLLVYTASEVLANHIKVSAANNKDILISMNSVHVYF